MSKPRLLKTFKGRASPFSVARFGTPKLRKFIRMTQVKSHGKDSRKNILIECPKCNSVVVYSQMSPPSASQAVQADDDTVHKRDVLSCPKCSTIVETNLLFFGRWVGAIVGALIGSSLGSRAGFFANLMMEMSLGVSATLVGAVVCSVIGYWIGGLIVSVKCTTCGRPLGRRDA